STARIRAFAKTDSKHGTGNTKVFDRPCQGKRVGRDNAYITLEVDEGFFIERFGINNCRVDVRENLEFVGATHVVAVAAGAVADYLIPIDATNLAGLERLYHTRLSRFPYPAIILNT